VSEHVKAHLMDAYKFIFSTSFISHWLNASYWVTKIWWPYSLITKLVKNIYRRFCSGDVNSEKQKMVRLWFTKNKRTFYFLLRFNFTH